MPRFLWPLGRDRLIWMADRQHLSPSFKLADLIVAVTEIVMDEIPGVVAHRLSERQHTAGIRFCTHKQNVLPLTLASRFIRKEFLDQSQ